VADKQNPDVVFGDRRSETIVVTDRSNGKADGTRTLRIEPDTLLDFRALPYPDGSFKLVAFDPPHLHTAGPQPWLAAKYGKLGPDWREDLRNRHLSINWLIKRASLTTPNRSIYLPHENRESRH